MNTQCFGFTVFSNPSLELLLCVLPPPAHPSGGHIVFGVDPVVVRVGVGFCLRSDLCELLDGFGSNLNRHLIGVVERND